MVARNWRCRAGEIDLVARQGRTVVVCEVKARSTLAFGTPAEAVTTEKRRRLRSLALTWLQESGLRGVVLRFDVAAVLDDQLEVFEGAF